MQWQLILMMFGLLFGLRYIICYSPPITLSNHHYIQVLTSNESKVVEVALKTITKVAFAVSAAGSTEDIKVGLYKYRSLSHNLSTNHFFFMIFIFVPTLGPAQKYMKPLVTQCVHELKSPDSKIAISCGKVLESASVSSGELTPKTA